jgi:hypothetical protein
MKRMFTSALGAILLACAGLTPTASAATEAEKLAAIQAGLAHLYSLQAGDGSWNVSGYKDAGTGSAVFSFLSQQAKWPAAQVTNYQAAVNKGIAFLLSDAVVQAAISTNGDGVNICPGGSGTCIGIYWGGGTSVEVYSTGLVTPAIDVFGTALGAGAVATTTGPLANLTWRQIAQGITNAFAASQSANASYPSYRGGWHYQIPGNVDSDSSTTQWGVLSIGYDESVGATTPAAVKSNLPTWLGNVQWTAAGANFGGVCYEPYPGCSIGPTHSDTGGWEVAMQYLGNNVNAAQLNGLTFLNTNWNQTANGTWNGLFGHPYAMWAVYKGLESTIGLTDTTHIASAHLRTDCGLAAGKMPGSGVCNWWEDFNEYLVRNQTSSTGAWPDLGGEWPDPLSTALFVNILGATPLPGTLGPPPTPTVPTLSVWGLVALGIMLAGFAAMRLRKAHSR